MKQNQNETVVIDIQLFATILSITSFAFTFILLYNQKLLEQKKKPIFSRETTLKLVALNRVFVFLIVLIFLSANFLQFKMDKEENNELTFDYLEILGSILTLTVSLISIYIAFKALENENLSFDDLADIALE